jgi:hypothetical protein
VAQVVGEFGVRGIDCCRNAPSLAVAADNAFGETCRRAIASIGSCCRPFAGSNTLWFAVVWIAPHRNTAYLAATNVGSDTALTACDAAIGKLIELSSSL